MRTASTRTLRRTVARSIVALSLSAPALLAVPATSPAQALCSSPPAVLPVASITQGMTGTGLTAVQGSTPTSFNIEVLGTYPNAILAGFDLVIFEITGPSTFLDRARGMAAGMSGSPIYINGELAGAASYRFFYSDNTIGLFTPAQKMVELLDYVDDPAALAMPDRLPVTRAVARTIARTTELPVGEVAAGDFTRLSIPLAVTGLNSRPASDDASWEKRLADREDWIQHRIDRSGLGLTVYRAGATATSLPPDPTPLAAGEPFASVLAVGDVTFAGIGTTTFACGDLNVAWGHPFFFEGDVSFAMGSADVVTILDDPSGIMGPFKILAPTEIHGSVTQDRLAGIVGVAGDSPPTFPVTSTMTNIDTGRKRDGRTDVYYQESWWGPDIVYEHMWQNHLAVFDGYTAGTSRITYTITFGTDDGRSFTVANRNMDYSDWYAFGAGSKLYSTLSAIQFNRLGEDITFTSVDADAELTKENLTGRIDRVLTSSSARSALADRHVIKARAGSTVQVVVELTPAGGGATQQVELELRIPRGARGEEKVDLGGGTRRYRFPSRGIGSIRELVNALSGGEHPNDVVMHAFGRRTLEEAPLIVGGHDGFTVQIV